MSMESRTSAPPGGLSTYRVITGPDDATFCQRVSEAVALGYLLYGSPSICFIGTGVVVAQAMIWPTILTAIAD